MNSNIIRIVIFSLLCLFVYAQKYCKIPSQWQAKMYERDNKKLYRSRVDYSYDAVNKKTRKIGAETIGNYYDYTDTLRIYNQQTEYKYSLVTGTCTKSKIEFDFKDFSIPENAQYLADLNIGLQSDIKTTSWGATIKSSQGEIFDFLGIYSEKNCLPFSLFFDSENSNYQVQLFNFTVGFNDPSTFVPRKECSDLF